MASFLQSLFSGKKKEFVSNSQTVKIEKDPNDPAKDILRFGDGKDDYFPVEGDKKDKEALREILSKVIESPTQLKKIKDLPLEDRPTLIRDHGGKVGGMPCGGYCDGNVISMTPSSGTGYVAAGIFCHEFQHQYQFKRGKGLHHNGMVLSEAILDDRINESAADTAKYQYMYEMKDKNLKARMAFEAAKLDRPGLKAYAAAKDKGKSEQDCMLAGMQGYATDYMTAHYYAKCYHGEVGEEEMQTLDDNQYTDNIRSAVGAGYFQNRMNGEKLDEVAAFKAHTVGMTTETCDDKKVNKALRSAEFNYVTPTIARAITRWAEKLKAIGRPISENPDKLNVRTAYGVTTNKERGGFAGMMFKAKTKLLSAKQKLKKLLNPAPKLGAKIRYHDRGKVDLDVSTDKNGNIVGKIPFHVQHGIAEEYKAEKEIGEKEVEKRTLKAQQMMAIVMESPYAKKKIEDLTAAGQEITLAFYKGVTKEGFSSQKTNTIVLDPSKSPEQLARDFGKHFHPMANDLLKKIESEKGTEKQTGKETAPKAAEQAATAAKVAEPKAAAPKQAEAKPVEKQAETKAAEPKQEINGEALLKMVDQLAFRASKTAKSDTYYKPTPVETKLIDSLAKYSKDMVKSAGIDYRSVQAKPFRAKCLAEWAQSPQGKSGVTKLLQAYGNMKAFEKPREKQPLMQTLQAQTRAQANQGQSLMGELNKQQAKNNAAKAATAQVARSTAQR